ncbi:hypothetical protein AMECASPLE_023337, partial [Ameca splendens]
RSVNQALVLIRHIGLQKKRTGRNADHSHRAAGSSSESRLDDDASRGDEEKATLHRPRCRLQPPRMLSMLLSLQYMVGF